MRKSIDGRTLWSGGMLVQHTITSLKGSDGSIRYLSSSADCDDAISPQWKHLRRWSVARQRGNNGGHFRSSVSSELSHA